MAAITGSGREDTRRATDARLDNRLTKRADAAALMEPLAPFPEGPGGGGVTT